MHNNVLKLCSWLYLHPSGWLLSELTHQRCPAEYWGPSRLLQLASLKHEDVWMCVQMLIVPVVSSSKCKECKEKCECTYRFCKHCAHIILAVMCIYVIYKCLSWGGDRQQNLGKPNQAINGKLLSVLSHVVGEKTQSALRKEQGWAHSLWCCQCLAT
jgi:hypothetical protein